jgi:integrase
MLVCDITADEISGYQAKRLKAGAAPKTINLEIGTLRAILRRQRIWANLQPDVKMLRTRDDVGRALSPAEEACLLRECRASRSKSLYVAVELALSTCMRYSEIRLLQWYQIDFTKSELRVGISKTEYGDGRVIPLNTRIRTVLAFWAERFPHRKPNHYVFPTERYGGRGKDEAFGFSGSVAYDTDPTQPIGDWKEAWEAAKKRAGVTCRFHDLRHTGCTRMLEAGVPFSVVSDVMGWSASTAIRMAKRYGHIGHKARREAVEKLEAATNFDLEGAQKWAQSHTSQIEPMN